MSWCPYRELGLARGASIDEVKKAFKDLAKAHHPDKHLASAPHEQSTAAERFRAIKEAYDTLLDDRKRAAYEASSATYQRRGSASWATAGVNTDWTRRSGESGGSNGGGSVSRPSRWEWWRRWARQEARAFDRTLHGGLALLTLGGLLLFDVGGDLVWSSRNAGRSFEAAMAAKAAAAAEAAKKGEVQQKEATAPVPPPPTSKRRPGAWLESMRGRRVDEGAAAQGDGSAATTMTTSGGEAERRPTMTIAQDDESETTKRL